MSVQQQRRLILKCILGEDIHLSPVCTLLYTDSAMYCTKVAALLNSLYSCFDNNAISTSISEMLLIQGQRLIRAETDTREPQRLLPRIAAAAVEFTCAMDFFPSIFLVFACMATLETLAERESVEAQRAQLYLVLALTLDAMEEHSILGRSFAAALSGLAFLACRELLGSLLAAQTGRPAEDPAEEGRFALVMDTFFSCGVLLAKQAHLADAYAIVLFVQAAASFCGVLPPSAEASSLLRRFLLLEETNIHVNQGAILATLLSCMSGKDESLSQRTARRHKGKPLKPGDSPVLAVPSSVSARRKLRLLGLVVDASFVRFLLEMRVAGDASAQETYYALVAHELQALQDPQAQAQPEVRRAVRHMDASRTLLGVITEVYVDYNPIIGVLCGISDGYLLRAMPGGAVEDFLQRMKRAKRQRPAVQTLHECVREAPGSVHEPVFYTHDSITLLSAFLMATDPDDVRSTDPLALLSSYCTDPLAVVLASLEILQFMGFRKAFLFRDAVDALKSLVDIPFFDGRLQTAVAPPDSQTATHTKYLEYVASLLQAVGDDAGTVRSINRSMGSRAAAMRYYTPLRSLQRVYNIEYQFPLHYQLLGIFDPLRRLFHAFSAEQQDTCPAPEAAAPAVERPGPIV